MSVAHRTKPLQTTTQPFAAKSSKLLHMSGEFTYNSVAHMPQPEMA